MELEGKVVAPEPVKEATPEPVKEATPEKEAPVSTELSKETTEEVEDVYEAETEDEEEPEVSVVKFEYNGIVYLKSDDNVLYNPDTKEEVGVWNEETESIDEIVDGEDED